MIQINNSQTTHAHGMTDMSQIAGILLSILFWATLYFLPSIIVRKKPFAIKVFLLNLFAGWTVIGWIASLILSLKSDKKLQSQSVDNINTNTILQLEKFNQLKNDGIISDDEFAIQKNRLLGHQIIAPKKNHSVTIAVTAILIIGFTYTTTNFVSTFYYNAETTVVQFLNGVKNNDTTQTLQQTDEYNQIVRQQNNLPKITGYVVLSSEKISNRNNEEIYHVSATVLGDDSNPQLVQNVTFVVAKRGFNYYIKNSYDFLQTHTNKISFPSHMGDIKRLEIAQQLNLTIELVSSTCSIKNNNAQGQLQVKNNYSLPVKNIQVQLQYVNKQQQAVKTETVNILANAGELQPQQTYTANFATANCDNCNTVNITLLTNTKN
ncbi:MAG TPA: superinfection immunity protein [Bacteroidia bacterium]|nr:superinfection immunity protein [Bacteroidia bacterium]